MTTPFTSLRGLAAASVVASMAIACGGETPSFPRPGVDAAVECVSADPSPADAGAADGSAGGLDAGAGGRSAAEVPCPSGQVCLQGRCYERCTGDDGCARTEMCSSSGVCVRRTVPRADAGPVDAGPTDPCDGVSCESPTPACHPVDGVCVQCADSTECPGQVCDRARGVCRGFAPRPCSPCDTDVQCTDPSSGTSIGSCTMLDADWERVCVPACDTDTPCPTGLTCMGDRCLPRVGTCTGWVAAVEGRGCGADTDCVPYGSVAAEGQCGGLVEGGTGVCLQPCGLATDCPSGLTCTGGFCGPAA